MDIAHIVFYQGNILMPVSGCSEYGDISRDN
ncbi:MAG: hypothetical protein J07HQW2_01318 [Haloquadratum walsbyi J07HQW2]|uniref:Uncharacterized protein n=1 Tax=Haloquadratum walsbyi J07HQW2 TaxID=1238425 RepID=U1PRD3_9EURY|nr:MAG: hypothetical protein J07HQW2_01318 [Haloquadratum walsbyi J07HQW2]